MNKIEIRGIIVSSDWDVDFMYPYIKRGIITPESYVRKQLTEADTKKDITLYINSPGGSVFSGNEMINALMDWKLENKKKINVVVGAMAASMGSAMLISLSDNVKVHSNSKIMFHGASGGNEGGAESMADTSELLDKINSDMKIRLVRQYNFNPDDVEEWFKEGREKWLTADEAIKCGMADEIIGGIADLPEDADNVNSMLNERGMQIAALTLKNFKQNGESKMEKLIDLLKNLFKSQGKVSDETVEEAFADFTEEEVVDEEVEETEEVVNDEETVEEDNEEGVIEDNEEEVVEELEAGQVDAIDEDGELHSEAELGHAEFALTEQIDELNEQCIAFEDKVKILNDALNKKQSENDKVKADIVKLTARCEKLLGGGIKKFESEESLPNDWKSCLDRCDGDYVEARKAYPEVYASFMSKKSK